MATDPAQRRIPLRRMQVINGSRAGGVLTGSAQRPVEYVLVCTGCGRKGGTLEKFRANATAGLDRYYHAACAPRELVLAKRFAQQIAEGSR